MGVHLKYTFDNVDDFYRECEIQTPGANSDGFENHCMRDESDFRGLSLNEIKDSKYCYVKGLEDLKEIDLDVTIGGKKTRYKWDESDGDDMNMERCNEGMACMSKRIPKHGNQNGKFINLNISIAENCNVSARQMLNRVYCAIQIADYLENAGFRVTIYAYDRTSGPGRLPSGEVVDIMDIRIVLKGPDEPLNKGLLLTTISPWFFRYWTFMFMYAKLNTSWGLGHTSDPGNSDTKEDIYIRSGECLSKQGADRRIKELQEFFKSDDEGEGE